jgi:hypothetical protein
MTLTPVPRTPDHIGPLSCFRCRVSAQQDPTVYGRVVITGEHQPPLCMTCATKLDRMARMARRES